MIRRNIRRCAIWTSLLFAAGGVAQAQTAAGSDPTGAYRALHSFRVDGGSGTVSNVTLKRDRVEMTFSGTFYFSQPVLGKVTGAVFIGKGAFRAEPPPSAFERDNLRRLLRTDVVESDFETAVLRFTDDTHSVIGQSHEPRGIAPQNAQDLATEFGARFARETGANPASRMLVSLLNNEQPGVFIAQFDKGRRGKFTVVLDHQARIPTVNFGINGGEKGLVFSYQRELFANNVWFAFYSQEDYQRGRVSYSDAFDQVATPRMSLDVDLRDPKKVLKVKTRAELVILADGVRAISFALSEGLPEFDELRRKKGMRIKAARLGDGTAVPAFQEEWEGGFLVVLPEAKKAKETLTIETEVEGDFVYDLSDTFDCSYPFINGEWYPRHGYLARSAFDLAFRHAKRNFVAGPGVQVKREAAPDNANEVITAYRMEQPVALVTFAMGPFQVYQEKRKLAGGELPIEMFSLEGGREVQVLIPGSLRPFNQTVSIKEDFVLAEMGNAVDYAGALFGKYPYPMFRAAFHPFGFGQGFATMLAIPKADTSSKYTFAFLAHETAHQWWGNIVAWRSYRDQWLSEGFAEYTGLLYMRERTRSQGDLREMLVSMRNSLKEPPVTDTGIGSGRVTDIGPLILGSRLYSAKSRNAYVALTYNKGALVLRMLHYLFTDPSTGDGKPFFDMMRDFVQRYRDSAASTEQFMQVASEHFARTPVARRYGVNNLTWFFRQWVWQTALPSYRLEYSMENSPDGKVLVKGTIYQDNAPEDWWMPLPLVFRFGRDQVARGSVLARGPSQAVSITLPARPESVELDPDLWVLSEKSSTKKQ
jgi:hypothetical protein